MKSGLATDYAINPPDIGCRYASSKHSSKGHARIGQTCDVFVAPFGYSLISSGLLIFTILVYLTTRKKSASTHVASAYSRIDFSLDVARLLIVGFLAAVYLLTSYRLVETIDFTSKTNIYSSDIHSAVINSTLVLAPLLFFITAILLTLRKRKKIVSIFNSALMATLGSTFVFYSDIIIGGERLHSAFDWNNMLYPYETLFASITAVQITLIALLLAVRYYRIRQSS